MRVENRCAENNEAARLALADTTPGHQPRETINLGSIGDHEVAYLQARTDRQENAQSRIEGEEKDYGKRAVFILQELGKRF